MSAINKTEAKKLAKIALKKAINGVKWHKGEPDLYPNILETLESEIQDAKKLIAKGNIKATTRKIVDIYDIADEEDMFDKRCNYPGCGSEIRKLVEIYMN